MSTLDPPFFPKPAAAVADGDRLAAIRLWLWLTVALVLLMVVVGGATRLTGSGLSITEWRPVAGAMPPLNAADWQAEFALYRASPQYELLNKGMSLAEFQFIYWWEWGHRQLGRFIGLFYLAGFVVVAARRMVSARTALLLFAMGLLLGLQGAIGWIMVASGLKPGMVAVAPVKLTLHLTFASLFLASLVAMATALQPRGSVLPASHPMTRAALIVLLMVFAQIALGGLVAGGKAGLAFNTWPLMDGHIVPPYDQLFTTVPWLENFIDNPALVQFNHRLLAYGLVVVTLWHALRLSLSRSTGADAKGASRLAALVLAQMALGIVTLLLRVPLWAGLAHQALAMIVLIAAVRHWAVMRAVMLR